MELKHMHAELDEPLEFNQYSVFSVLISSNRLIAFDEAGFEIISIDLSSKDLIGLGHET